MSEAKPVGTATLFLAGIAAALATLVAMACLPHDPSVRWHSVRLEAFARLGWVHERIHNDPTPVDVAFIGTSHSMNGIDGQAVAERMAARGARTPSGRCYTVTNLAIPSYGRNLHALLAKELLQNRKVGTLVLEVLENETRKPHPLFWSVASSRDIVGAPMLINTYYFYDLVRLPYRQLSLFIQSLWPEQFGIPTGFDPRRYDGSTVDNTRVVNVGGQELTPPLTMRMDREKLERTADRLNADKDLNLLPKQFERFEYRLPESSLEEIRRLAEQSGTRLILFYLPRYKTPPQPFDMRFYKGLPMIEANDILANPTIWWDEQHLNAEGAALVSRRLGDILASRPDLRVSPEPTDLKGCSNGFPPRATLKPYRRPHAQ